jgi:hypothetical protein
MKLIILGNGFDLHHGYKTSFYDFRNFLLSSKRTEDSDLVALIDSILYAKKEIADYNILWNKFEEIVGIKLKNSPDIKAGETKVSDVIEDFTQRFHQYLLKLSELKTDIYSPSIAKELESAAAILTFNFTKFYENYQVNPNAHIFHIHGDLSQDNLPLIGYYYPEVRESNTNSDFFFRFGQKIIHKPALAYKQNVINFEDRVQQFIKKHRIKMLEIIVIGYSFGASDSHIYSILNSIIVAQPRSGNIPSSEAEKIPVLKFKIFSYDMNESKKIESNIRSWLMKIGRSNSTINVTGLGFKPSKKEIINFSLVDY